MKYMLMMNVPKTAHESFAAWPQDALKAHIAWQLNFDKTLRASGVLVSAEGLASAVTTAAPCLALRSRRLRSPGRRG